MSGLVLPRRRIDRADQLKLVGASFGKVGPRGELGMCIIVNGEQGRAYKLGRTLRREDFLKLRDTIDKVLAGMARDATAETNIV